MFEFGGIILRRISFGPVCLFSFLSSYLVVLHKFACVLLCLV